MESLRPATILLLMVFSAAAGCATSQYDLTPDACRDIFLAEMRIDGVLLLHDLRVAASGSANVVNTVAPSRADYADMVAWAGSPRPGETRRVPHYDGSVSMDENGVLTIIHSGDSSSGLVVEPSTGVLRPGQPGYAEMLERIGGVEPGHFKGLPTQASCPAE